MCVAEVRLGSPAKQKPMRRTRGRLSLYPANRCQARTWPQHHTAPPGDRVLPAIAPAARCSQSATRLVLNQEALSTRLCRPLAVGVLDLYLVLANGIAN